MIVTVFIHYRPATFEDATTLITRWLDEQYVSFLYLEDSAWLTTMDLPVAEIRDQLKMLIHEGDSLLIFEVGPAWSSLNLSKGQSRWLERNWHPGLPRVK